MGMVVRGGSRKGCGKNMIKISGIKLNIGHDADDLKKAAASKLSINASDITGFKILRRSIEARKMERLSYVYSILLSLKDEKKIKKFLGTARGKSVSVTHKIEFVHEEEKYVFPYPLNRADLTDRPVVIGSGPAGMLCAYELAKGGYKPVIIERGLPVDERVDKVKAFWEGGPLDEKCNVQFGEGGAGTFSDGKLNTGVNDKFHRHDEVFSLFVKCGASEEILYDAKPHVGTDILQIMVRNIRKEIEKFGGEYVFEKCVVDITTEDSQLTGLVLDDGTLVKCKRAVFAIGHSARDTFDMLYRHGISMKAKAFAVGVRAEHSQEMINRNQWGDDYPKELGSAPYKLTYRTASGRNVYTFCMCPGGYVVNASSEKGHIAVNGMSYSGRASGRANSAVIVSVGPDDFENIADVPEALKGVAFQRRLEEKAYSEGEGAIPIQFFGDFMSTRPSGHSILEAGAYKGNCHPGDINNVLPEFICSSVKEGMKAFDKKIKGFASDDAILYAVESRTSSPVRIERDESFQSNIKGIFPCGEGAGYAGGITSAAIDGIKTAEMLAKDILIFTTVI